MAVDGGRCGSLLLERMASYRIPFNRPGLAGNELRYIQESVDSGRISGDGIFTEKCRRLLEELLGARQVLLTTSCTTPSRWPPCSSTSARATR